MRARRECDRVYRCCSSIFINRSGGLCLFASSTTFSPLPLPAYVPRSNSIIPKLAKPEGPSQRARAEAFKSRCHLGTGLFPTLGTALAAVLKQDNAPETVWQASFDPSVVALMVLQLQSTGGLSRHIQNVAQSIPRAPDRCGLARLPSRHEMRRDVLHRKNAEVGPGPVRAPRSTHAHACSTVGRTTLTIHSGHPASNLGRPAQRRSA